MYMWDVSYISPLQSLTPIQYKSLRLLYNFSLLSPHVSCYINMYYRSVWAHAYMYIYIYMVFSDDV